MNYAWANPSTGIREQSSTPEEARLRVWEELQMWVREHAAELPTPEPPTVQIFAQEAAGWCSAGASDCVLKLESPMQSYAYADPATGKRLCTVTWEKALECLYDEWPLHSPVDQVTIYRQHHHASVRFDDPKPELPPPVEIPQDTPESLIEQVLSGNCPDLGRAQLLAMLWIAESSMELVLESRRHRRTARRNPPVRRSHRRYPNLWGYIKQAFRRWWRGFLDKHAPLIPQCEACGLPLEDPDGKICPNCAAYILRRMGMEEEARHASPPPPRDFQRPRSGSAEKKEEGSAPLSEDAMARAIRERNRTPDPNKPHVYDVGKGPRIDAEFDCCVCGKPEHHAIHGWTGD